MNNNTQTFATWTPMQRNSFETQQDGFMDSFSSPTSESDALQIRHEPTNYFNFSTPSPSPPTSREASHAYAPLSSVRHYSGWPRHGHNDLQDFGIPTQSYSHDASHDKYDPSSYNSNIHLNRSETPALYRPVSVDQNPSALSRPITQYERAPKSHVTGYDNTTRNGFGWRLRPVSELPDRFRGMFKFGVFNAVQSACFDQVLHSQENLVISAPTGSGKTVLFELSMIRMLSQTTNDARSAKCVYVAPTKALCAEKHNEWTAKFSGLGVKCCELTGDTLLLGRGVWGDAKSAHIIVTTAEKWDSLTRNWTDHSGILSQVKLFLVDEVHILNEPRGSTLEVVISRMKARESNTRFLLISATIPNVEDVAQWIGSSDGNDQPARIFQFGDEFRPCKLTKFVYSVAKPKGQNDFAYARTLDLRLFPLIQRHSTNKPILVFCPTRKGTLDTARQLAKDYDQTMKGKQNLPWPPPARIDQKFHDKDLASLVSVGIAVHHAGLNADDRRAVEDLYLRKALRILVATSTLAVGVNLPAQMVVIKGVKLYQNGEMKEYSDLDIMQMMGRAGRPQFDDEGIAIILCEPELEHKYRTLTQGNTTLESSLHRNLAEHLNAEIGLGTISTLENAKDWLRRSFLFCRMQKNPLHYDIGKNENQTWEEKVDEIVMQSVLNLRETQLIEYVEKDGKLSSTEYGDIMSKFYIRQTTMRAILKLPFLTTMREILELVSISEEVSELKLRSGEKPMYEKIRRHNDIRFPPKKAVSISDKILLLIQAILGGLPLNSPEFKSTEGQPYLEAISIFRHATRIVSAVAEVAIANRNGSQLKHALELIRSFSAKAWEDRPLVLRQIEQIGEKSVKVLAENGINSIPKLLQTPPARIEELLNRRPPFGYDVLAAANEFPKYHLSVKEIRSTHSDGNSPVEVEFAVQCGLIFGESAPLRFKKSKWGKTEMTTLLILTSDMDFIDFRRIATKALREQKDFTLTAQLTKPSQSINVYITSEKFAGVTVARTLTPSVPPEKYPTLETRPLTSVEMDLQGLEDIPGFWDFDLDVNSDETLESHVLDYKKCDADENTSSVQQSQLTGIAHSVERDPRKRPDGKYECNHACKDKLRCRHYCCQEGLPEPPRATRKKKEANAAAQFSDMKSVLPPRRLLHDKQKWQPVLDSQTHPTKRNSVPQQLKKISENAIARSLRSADLESPVNHTKQSRSSKTVPNFDLQLTTLKRSRSPSRESTFSDDNFDEFSLISEVWKKDQATTEVEGREVPPPKRSRKGVDYDSPGSRSLHEKIIPQESLSSKRLFLYSSDEEDSASQRNDHYAVMRPTGPVVDTYIDKTSANDWNAIQPASATFGMLSPRESTQGYTPPTNSNALSPSRIRAFIHRSLPDDPVDDPTSLNPRGLVSRAAQTPEINGFKPRISDDASNLNDTLDDALAEFDRWLASGAVEIILD